MTTFRTTVTRFTTTAGTECRVERVRETVRERSGFTSCRTVRFEVVAAGREPVVVSAAFRAWSAAEAAGW